MASFSKERLTIAELELRAVNKPSFMCKQCGKIFSRSSSLSRHKKSHLSDEVKTYKHPCGLCRRRFNHLKHLTFHMKTIHSIITPKTPKMYCCALCKVGFPKDSILYHLKRIHNVKCVSEELKFKDFKDFLEWKGNVEKKTRSLFFNTCRSKHVNNEYHYYACNRSCECVPRSRTLRHLKLQAARKTYCPASISVLVKNDECNVTYCSTHTGHSNDESPLPQEEKLEVASEVTSNLPCESIFSDNANSTCDDDDPQRLHQLTKNALRNVKLTPCQGNPIDTDDYNDSSLSMPIQDEAESLMSNEPLSSSENEESSLGNLKTLLRKILEDNLNYISNYNEGLVLMKQLCSIPPMIDVMRNANSLLDESCSVSVLDNNEIDPEKH